jgi:predicted Ser/Thr protein kinase
MIDFERAHFDLNPGNVTQFCQYVMGKLDLDMAKTIALGKEYKKNPNEENYNKILNLFLSS